MEMIFDIYKDDSGHIKIRIGNGLYTLNQKEVVRLKEFFTAVLANPLGITVPNSMKSIVIMYENGTVAMQLSIGTLGLPPQSCLLFVTCAPPSMIRYDTAMFLLDWDTINEYVAAL